MVTNLEIHQEQKIFVSKIDGYGTLPAAHSARQFNLAFTSVAIVDDDLNFTC